jgi:hypothetical protein
MQEKNFKRSEFESELKRNVLMLSKTIIMYQQFNVSKQSHKKKYHGMNVLNEDTFTFIQNLPTKELVCCGGLTQACWRIHSRIGLSNMICFRNGLQS